MTTSTSLLPYQNKSLIDMHGELWKDIPGFEGSFQASTLGRVKSLDRIVPHPRLKQQSVKGQILSQSIGRNRNIVAVDPIDIAATRQQKKVVFSTRNIRVTGMSERIIPVNEWLARIKTRPWVKNVQLDSYAFNSELNTGQFSVMIDY
jgi:hypothetical protein